MLVHPLRGVVHTWIENEKNEQRVFLTVSKTGYFA